MTEGDEEHSHAAFAASVAVMDHHCDQQTLTAVSDFLKANGMVTAPASSPRAAIGVLVFGDDTEGLAERVLASAQQGTHWLLAVGATDAALRSELKWRVLAAGATDVISWSGGSQKQAILGRLNRWREIEKFATSSRVTSQLVGNSQRWRAALRCLVEIARFGREGVLITGESGTGKELAARLIHALDPRANASQLVVVDCTTIVPTLSGSELFGHEKGAFTGASNARDGAFALADGGTLFLDEIGELPLAIQAELLRVIQEGTYKRVGSSTWRSANFRLICATNRDLTCEDVFRKDLYHRIACWQLKLPSLRDRDADILPLFQHFASQCGCAGVDLDDSVREFLLCREYPGNVRELRQLATRICRRHAGGPITAGDIPREEWPAVDTSAGSTFDTSLVALAQRALSLGMGLKDTRKALEGAMIATAIDQSGSILKAARTLGLTARALQMRAATDRRESAPPLGSDEENCAQSG